MLSKASFFAWEASLGKVLTMDQLQKREWPLVNKCFFCKYEEESTNHILLHCVKVRVLRQLLFALFNVHWLQATTVKETLIGWHGSIMGKRRKKVGRVTPLHIF